MNLKEKMRLYVTINSLLLTRIIMTVLNICKIMGWIPFKECKILIWITEGTLHKTILYYIVTHNQLCKQFSSNIHQAKLLITSHSNFLLINNNIRGQSVKLEWIISHKNFSLLKICSRKKNGKKIMSKMNHKP